MWNDHYFNKKTGNNYIHQSWIIKNDEINNATSKRLRLNNIERQFTMLVALTMSGEL